MTSRDDDREDDRERAAEAERRLEILRKEAQDQALECILKDAKREERSGG